MLACYKARQDELLGSTRLMLPQDFAHYVPLTVMYVMAELYWSRNAVSFMSTDAVPELYGVMAVSTGSQGSSSVSLRPYVNVGGLVYTRLSKRTMPPTRARHSTRATLVR